MSTATTKLRPAQVGLTLATAYMAVFAVIAFWPRPELGISPVTHRQIDRSATPQSHR